MTWLGQWVAGWLPEWFGLESGPPGSMSAGLSGAGTLTAALSAIGEPAPVPVPGGGSWPRRIFRLLFLARRIAAQARLSGAGTLTATLTANRPDRTPFFRKALALLLADSAE